MKMSKSNSDNKKLIFSVMQSKDAKKCVFNIINSDIPILASVQSWQMKNHSEISKRQHKSHQSSECNQHLLICWQDQLYAKA